jgi:D-lactate dehydrogenase
MKVAVFDTHKFDRLALETANHGRHELRFLEVRLTEETAMLALGYDAVCLFANDRADEKSLSCLKAAGVKLIALRSAGYNHVNIKCAQSLGMTVVRVPAYSPYAVAEYAVALLQTFNRKIHKAHIRVHDMNFSLDGLVGFDLHGKTVGVIGTGKIGKVFCQIMAGYGCRVLAMDSQPDQEWALKCNVSFVSRDVLFAESDIVSLHVPLTPETRHLINAGTLAMMKKEVVIVNTGRGALIDTKALIAALKKHRIAGACLDVYEEEAGIFFSDLSESGISDDLLARLLTFPNVLVTSHQAFLTSEALKNIAETTISSISRFEEKAEISDVEVRF